MLGEIDGKIAIVFRYWQSKSEFNSLVRELNWGKVRDVPIEKFSKVIESNQSVIATFEQSKFDINPINMNNLAKFRE